MTLSSRQFSVRTLLVATLFVALFSAWARLINFQLLPALLIVAILLLLLAIAALFWVSTMVALEWTLSRPRRVVLVLGIVIMAVVTICRLLP